MLRIITSFISRKKQWLIIELRERERDLFGSQEIVRMRKNTQVIRSFDNSIGRMIGGEGEKRERCFYLALERLLE